MSDMQTVLNEDGFLVPLMSNQDDDDSQISRIDRTYPSPLIAPRKHSMSSPRSEKVFTPGTWKARKQIKTYLKEFEEKEFNSVTKGGLEAELGAIFSVIGKSSRNSMTQKSKHRDNSNVLDDLSKLSLQAPLPRSQKKHGIEMRQRRSISGPQNAVSRISRKEVRRSSSDTPKGSSCIAESRRRRPSRQAHLGRRLVHSPCRKVSTKRGTTRPPPPTQKLLSMQPSTPLTVTESTCRSTMTPLDDQIEVHAIDLPFEN